MAEWRGRDEVKDPREGGERPWKEDTRRGVERTEKKEDVNPLDTSGDTIKVTETKTKKEKIENH